MIKYIKKEVIGWVPIFVFPADGHTNGLLALLYLSVEGVTEIENDPKRRSVSFKVTSSNCSVICVYVPSGHNTRE